MMPKGLKVYLGSDHAGVQMKAVLRDHLKLRGVDAVDLGTFDEETKVDYPDMAREVAEKVTGDPAYRGVLICGTGIGVSIAANKMKGVRAAHVHDVTEARLARQHNDANIVTLGQRMIGVDLGKDIVDAFLGTAFEGGRHQARVDKLNAMDDD
jgi:ribose 5-phosphate isomerase B